METTNKGDGFSKENKERLERDSIRYGNLMARADLWMRVFRGAMVLAAILSVYAIVFTMLEREMIAVLIVGVLLLVLFGILERLCKRRSEKYKKEKAQIREEYTKVCDWLERQ